MTKTATLFCLLTGLLLSAQAQITVTQSDMPAPGQAFVSYNDTAGPTGMIITQAGGNQVWDYSSGWSIGSANNAVYQTPSNVNGFALFPTATVGISLIQNNMPTNFFYRLTPTSFNILGGTLSNTVAQSTVSYPNGNTAVQLPLTFGQSFSFVRRQVAVNSYTIPGMYTTKMCNTSTGSAVCDAWGSLSLPSGTAQVLRVKTTITSEIDTQYVDSTNTGNNWEFVFRSTGTPPTSNYGFFRNGSPSNILSLNADNTTGVINLNSYSSFTATALKEEERQASPFYPNPASNCIRIMNDEGKNVFVRITDLSGKIVHRCNISGVNILQINTEGLSNGLYLVEVCDADGVVTKSGKCMVQK